MRDYVRWHDAYGDPASSLSWRLRRVQDLLGAELDARPGAVRLVSACSGDGRDVLGVLRNRSDADRVRATLIEVHPDIAAAAAAAAEGVGAPVDVRTADAGVSDSYRAAVPADVVLLVGILGNISDDDIRCTLAAAPQLCAAGATLLWSRGVSGNDTNELVRGLLADAGFDETGYDEQDGAALGVARFVGEPKPLRPGERWFTFLR